MNVRLRRLPITLLVVACAAGAAASHPARAAADGPDAELHLVLNVAGNMLQVFERGVLTQTFGVSVGLPGYETPAGEYRIREVIWNPWWHPPNSRWAQGRKIEPPGESNPMGRVKLNFAPLLYIHGTPEYQALGSPSSRGCIRMRNSDVIELTRLVHRYASPKVDEATIQRLIAAPTQTRTIALARPVRLTAKYQIATVNDGFLIIYPDVYRRVGSRLRTQVEGVLKQSGVDPRDVNRERFERLLEKSVTRRVAMSLDSLVAVESQPEPQDGGR